VGGAAGRERSSSSSVAPPRRAPSRAAPTPTHDQRRVARHTSPPPAGGWAAKPTAYGDKSAHPPRPGRHRASGPPIRNETPPTPLPLGALSTTNASSRRRAQRPASRRPAAGAGATRHRGKAKPKAARGARAARGREEIRAPVAARRRRPARDRQRPVEPAGQRPPRHHPRRGSMAEHLRPSTARPGHQAKTKPADATSAADRDRSPSQTRGADAETQRMPRRRDQVGRGARSTESGPPTRSRPANG
jgi:hypothetical protein